MASADAMIGRTLGPYLITERIGSGGMGTVYRATHRALEQTRALKILPPQLAADATFVQRFQREARLAAELRHDNVVLIYDIAEQDTFHYLVMDLVEGVSLRELVRASGPLPLERVVRIIEQLAAALDFAHAHGVIHRDVKPANVLVGPDDHVTLVDFGIARAASELGVTAIGQIVGTPEYIAPEVVVEGEVTPQADLYALGIVAYELLTGQVPFSGTATSQVLFAQANRPPPPPRALRDTLAESVESALLRQLDKAPERRFPTAAAFVVALRGATPPAPPDGPDPAPPPLTTPDAETHISLTAPTRVTPRTGQVSLRPSHSLDHARASVMGVTIGGSPEHLATASSDRLVRIWRLDAPEQPARTLSGHANQVTSVAFSPDGTLLASGGMDSRLKLWRVADGSTVRTIGAHRNWVSSVAFSPDGTTLASASADGSIRLWRVSDGEQLRAISGVGWWINSVAFSPDGAHIVAGSRDGSLRIWRPEDGHAVATILAHTSPVTSVAVSPDSALVASASRDRSIRVWRRDDLRLHLKLEGHTEPVLGISFAPGGQMLASGAADQTARLWSVQSGQCLATAEAHRRWVTGVAWSGDGRLLATASEDGTARLWEID
ncbi:MAG: serine/threonine-protein kinase [Chloroflexota bacterium]